MQCPICGKLVPIYSRKNHGSKWKCGCCGHVGYYGWEQTSEPEPEPEPEHITLTVTVSFTYHIDLAETWSGMKKALRRLAPKEASLSRLLGKVLLHSISEGIRHAGALADEKKEAELRTFVRDTPELKPDKSTEKLMRDIRQGVLFRDEAELSETDCGTFWTKLMAVRPAEEYYDCAAPDGLYELISELSSAYAYFGGKDDEEADDAQEYKNAL